MTDRKLKSDGNIDIEPSGSNSTNVDSDLNVTGTINGDVTGNVTGDVTGDVKATDGTTVIDNGTDGTDLNIPVDLSVAQNLSVTGTINNFNFPSSDGTNGQVLATDSNGNLSFQTISASGSGGTGDNVYTFSNQTTLGSYSQAEGNILVLDNFVFDFTSSGINTDLKNTIIYVNLPSTGTVKFKNLTNCTIFINNNNTDCEIQVGDIDGCVIRQSISPSTSLTNRPKLVQSSTTNANFGISESYTYIKNSDIDIRDFDIVPNIATESDLLISNSKIKANVIFLEGVESSNLVFDYLYVIEKSEIRCKWLVIDKDAVFRPYKTEIVCDDIFMHNPLIQYEFNGGEDNSGFIKVLAKDKDLTDSGATYGSVEHQIKSPNNSHFIINNIFKLYETSPLNDAIGENFSITRYGLRSETAIITTPELLGSSSEHKSYFGEHIIIASQWSDSNYTTSVSGGSSKVPGAREIYASFYGCNIQFLNLGDRTANEDYGSQIVFYGDIWDCDLKASKVRLEFRKSNDFTNSLRDSSFTAECFKIMTWSRDNTIINCKFKDNSVVDDSDRKTVFNGGNHELKFLDCELDLRYVDADMPIVIENTRMRIYDTQRLSGYNFDDHSGYIIMQGFKNELTIVRTSQSTDIKIKYRSNSSSSGFIVYEFTQAYIDANNGLTTTNAGVQTAYFAGGGDLTFNPKVYDNVKQAVSVGSFLDKIANGPAMFGFAGTTDVFSGDLWLSSVNINGVNYNTSLGWTRADSVSTVPATFNESISTANVTGIGFGQTFSYCKVDITGVYEIEYSAQQIAWIIAGGTTTTPSAQVFIRKTDASGNDSIIEASKSYQKEQITNFTRSISLDGGNSFVSKKIYTLQGVSAKFLFSATAGDKFTLHTNTNTTSSQGGLLVPLLKVTGIDV